ncbi:MAG: hypothetical protein HC779_06965 [Phyllobacteriaceae bacterium]|nr:hypothetical protein [Phyllobacteriaceae bacterium]
MTRQRSRRYKLRAKVTIAERADLAVVASPEPLPGACADPRLVALGFRTITTTPHGGDEAAYHAHRIALGVPDSADLPSETLFPLDCNFEELQGVDFAKGCYVGQEVVSRMQHRGTARRRAIVATAELPLPAGLVPILAGEREIGHLGTVAGNRALAIVRLDRLDDARQAGIAVTAGGVPLAFELPVGAAFPLKPVAEHG